MLDKIWSFCFIYVLYLEENQFWHYENKLNVEVSDPGFI